MATWHTDPEPADARGYLVQRDMTFVVSPPDITFHTFKPHNKYEAKLVFKNQTKTPKYIRLQQPQSRFFKLSEPRGGVDSLKVAAGLTVTYTVTFTPEADVDYDCDLVASTEHERFIVPVRAVASRGRLTLPSVVHFPDAPIKATSRLPVLLANTGTKQCRWKATPTPPFAIAPAFGTVDAGQSMQVQVEFTPTSLVKYDSDLVFDLGSGDTQALRLTGVCTDARIRMSTDTLAIPKTFISLERQQVVRVTNESDSTVSYAWKAHPDEDGDAAAAAASRVAFGGTGGRKSSAPAAASDRARLGTLTAARSATAGSVATMPDPSLYDDDVFTIEPIRGAIPAKGAREFVVTFNPQLAMSYLSTAFLDVHGKSTRLPLTLKGTGLGPQCALSFDSLDLGDIFINFMHQYEVVLENRGSIEASFTVLPQQTLFGPKFKFSPPSGTIPAGASETLSIAFCSDIIGIVAETFKIHVQGSRDELELHFKGRVIGPTFHFDVEEIDYGNVSYNFWHVKLFHLINTSEIPMHFHLRVPEDGQNAKKEFDVIPSSGKILPHGQQKIQVDFLSNTVQEYNAHLVVDIDEVGDNLDSLPIKATCIVPDVSVSRDALDFGQCFVMYPYTLDVELKNDTALSAKYEFILPADDDPIRKKAGVAIGSGDVKERKGTVEARSTERLKVTFTAKQTGSIHLPLFVRILGSERAPHHIAISAKVTGPKIEVQPKSLDFGNLDVLTELTKALVISNDSPIPATYTAKLTAKHSSEVLPPFVLKQTEGTINSYSTSHLQITAFLDEAMKFADELVLSVQNNAEPEVINLAASGRGFTLIPSIPMDLVDFGDLFTTIPARRTFTLFNKGRREQEIQWANDRGKLKEGDPPVVFTITPERATIKGKGQETFTIEGLSQQKGVFREVYNCKMSRSHKLVFKGTFQGSFQPPLLQYSATQVPFVYVYNPEGPPNFLSKRPLTMKNVSPLDLDFTLRIVKQGSDAHPFSIDATEFSLKKGESAVVNVAFDAAYRDDRLSHKVSTKLVVSFANHSHRDNITLSGDLQFPNVEMETTAVDFGCILNDTEQRRKVTVTNVSKVTATYTWVFEEDAPDAPPVRGKAKDDTPVPVNNVFDLIPFRGVIPPGATEHIEVLFNGLPGRKFGATAVCQVEGGPDYRVQLGGEASSIQYKFDRVTLDYGSQEYDTWLEKEIFLVNTGRVPFPFSVDMSKVSRPGMIEAVPTAGMVRDKQRILVRFSPRVPDKVNDHFRIQVAHFEPQLINVRGCGLYSSVALAPVGTASSISRNDPPNFRPYLAEARKRVPADAAPKPAKRGDAEPFIDPVLAEAERLYFRDIITEDAVMMKALELEAAYAADADPSAAATAAPLPVATPEQESAIKRKVNATTWKYILSRYVLDLGNIIRGETKKRSFKIVNTSAAPILFSIDKKQLAAQGIAISPEKYPKLAAGTSLVLDVTLSTKQKGTNVGPYRAEVIVDIKGGPLVLMDVVATVIVPAIDLTESDIPFGTVRVGMTRIVTLGVKNTQALPCDWSVSYASDSLEPKKKVRGQPLPERQRKFIVSPERGVLQPQQSAVVRVSFVPTATEESLETLLFKVSSNPKPYDVRCTGAGEELQLALEPSSLQLDAVFPHQSSTRTVTLHNQSNTAVEVYSLDFDRKYLVEEEVLHNVGDLYEDDVLLLAPREVGEALPDYLMEAYYTALKRADDEFERHDLLPPSVPASARGEEKPPLVQPTIPLPPLDQHHDEPEAPKPTLLLVTGPPLCGKTTHAGLIAEHHGLLALDVDAVVRAAMEHDTAEGAAFRSLSQTLADTGLRSPDLPPGALAAVLKRHFAVTAGALHQGLVVDDAACFLTSNPEAVLVGLKDAALGAGLAFVCLTLTVDETLISLREASITRALSETALAAAQVQPMDEDEYDRLDDASRRRHDLALKHLRDCKKALQNAQSEVRALEQRRQKMLQAEAVVTVQHEAERSVVETPLEETGATKRKPTAKAAKQVVPTETPPPPPKWEDLSALDRSRRVHLLLRQHFDDFLRLVPSDHTTPLETHRAISDGVQFARCGADSTLLGHDADTGADVVLSPPRNMQRVQRTAQRRTPSVAPFFTVLPPEPVAPVHAPVVEAVKPPSKEAKSKAGKQSTLPPPPPPPPEPMVDETRWIIEPHGSVDVTVQFCSNDIGSIQQRLGFGIVGATQEFTLSCTADCSCPDILRDAKAIFPKRAARSAKAYSAQRKRFEFGPILVVPTKPAANPKEAKGKKSAKSAPVEPVDTTPQALEHKGGLNVEKLKFTNTGLFAADVSLYMEVETDKTFVVTPDRFSLAVGDTAEVRLIAQPDVAGDLRNAVVACIKDNPEPLRLEVHCTGSKPDITLDDKKDASIDFGRLLLRRQEERVLTLRNVSALPSKWRLVGLEKLAPELKLSATSGVMLPGATLPLRVSFSSERAGVFSAALSFEVGDAEGNVQADPMPLALKAEAHDVVLEWTQALDFKTVRVGESKKETIRLLNKGPYEVQYQLRLPRKLQEVLTVSPMEGTLRGTTGHKDAAVSQIEVVFKSDKETQIVNKRGSGEIEISFIDPTLKELVYPPQQTTVAGEALYNKYQIKPMHINFGPCFYKQKKQAMFDIFNTGCFDIKYRLFSMKDGLQLKSDVPEVPDKKAGKPADKKGGKGKEAVDTSEMQIGSFTLTPSMGVIPVGGSASVTVSILPEGNHNFHDVLGIHIEDRDPAVHRDGIPFDLDAESCVPGIIADLEQPDSDSIFEEQHIVQRLDGFRKQTSVYARDDRVFSFGTGLTGRKVQERFRISNPAKVPCTVHAQVLPRGDAPDARAAAEVFEILGLKQDGGKMTIAPHEHKYVTVSFMPNSLNTFSAFFEANVEGGLEPKTKQLRFELRGEGSLPNVALDIPPPPVKASEAPAAADPPPTKGPSKKQAQNPAKAAAQVKVDEVPPNTLVMARTIVGTKSARAVTVRNTGELPATIRFALPTAHNPCFSFPARNEDITVPPGAVERYQLFFEPSHAGDYTAKLQMVVQDNHYEDVSVGIQATGYNDTLTLSDVDENTENRLSLGDCYVNEPKTRSFSITNHSATTQRYHVSSPHASFKVSPSIGHLRPGSTRKIDVTFCNSAPGQEQAKAAVAYTAIEVAPSKIPEWDETLTIAKWREEAGDADDDMYSAARRPLRKVVEPVPEPSYASLDAAGAKELYLSCTCDVTQYEITLPDDPTRPPGALSLQFQRTKLLQRRAVAILLKNTGKVQLPFEFTTAPADPATAPDDDTVNSFVVEPASGTVPPNQSRELVITFKPLTVGDHTHLLHGRLPFGPKPDAAIELLGSSECPLVHFDLAPSDYLSTRDIDLGPVDPAACVVEFHSRGINVRNTMRFMVLNPTNLGYEFEWAEDSRGATSPFRCVTPRGLIHSGKKYEMVFEFSPEVLRLHESLWRFNIVGQTSLPFVLAGHVSEPEVYFSSTKLQFGQVLVGAKSKQVVYLENRESMPFPFAFDALPPNSAVQLSVMSGAVPPNGTVAIEVIFSPTSDESYNCSLACRVRKAVSAITCNVKGEGYTTCDSLRMLSPDGTSMPLLPGVTAVDLGHVQVNGRVSRKFFLGNAGRFNLDYKWQMAPHPALQLSPLLGTVVPGNDAVCELSFEPPKEGQLKEHRATLKVTNGPAYTVVLAGAATVPNVQLSWKQYNFGPVFLNLPGEEMPSVVLTMVNRDRDTLAVDCLFDGKEHLDVDVSTFVLRAQEKRDIRIQFQPRDAVAYAETISFRLNDLTTVSVNVAGEGTLPKVDVLSKVARLGVTRVGERRDVEVRVACKSKIPTAFSLEGCLPAEAVRQGVTVQPAGLVYLKPRETKPVVFSFRPDGRLRQFQYDLKMKVAGQELPFTVLSGSCQGAEVHLDNKQVTFGPVVVGTRVTKRVTILNTGDIGLQYQWSDKRLAPDFTISPTSGYIPAHADFACELTYHPAEIGRDGRRDAVELTFDEAPPLALQIIGAMCVERPLTTEIIPFACRVRETVVQKIQVRNESPLDVWTVRPVIDNSVWTGPEVLVIKPRETADYVLTYAPQVCTKLRPEEAKDIGTMFLPLPTGNAVLYRLEGTSELPAVAAPPIEREISAKVLHTEKLTVTNWLKTTQRFTVTMKWAHDPSDDSVSIKGVPSLDVPANSSREFKLQVLGYREGKVSGSIHFVNEATREYQFYNVNFTVRAAKEVASLEFRTPCRVRKTQEVVINNPLSKPVTLAAKFDHPDLVVPPAVQVQPKSSAKIPIEFFPLLPKEHPPTRVLFTCPELGEFPYALALTALPAAVERPVRISCALGQSVSTTLRFTHYCKAATDFSFKFADSKQSSFMKSNGQGTIKVTPCADVRVGQEVSVDVTYEPSRAGDSRETAEISSSVGGVYSFSLHGTCTPPQRQGPFDIKPGQTAMIQFKNVFSENVPFQFTTDMPQFVVSKSSEAVPAKKSTAISVQYKSEDLHTVLRGKLTVSGTPQQGDGNPVTWVYYLRGLRESDVVELPPTQSKPSKR